jgi:hypothetical protein
MTQEDLKKFDYINCIICDSKIQLLDGTPNRFSKPKYNPVSQMWNNGMIERISAGFGSKHDGDMFYIGICDECTVKKFKDGTLRYAGAYMNEEYTDDKIFENDKMRNRKNNLSNLIK